MDEKIIYQLATKLQQLEGRIDDLESENKRLNLEIQKLFNLEKINPPIEEDVLNKYHFKIAQSEERVINEVIQKIESRWTNEFIKIDKLITSLFKEVELLTEDYLKNEKFNSSEIQRIDENYSSAIEKITNSLHEKIENLLYSKITESKESQSRREESLSGVANDSMCSSITHQQGISANPEPTVQEKNKTNFIYCGEPIADIFIERRFYNKLQPRQTFYIISYKTQEEFGNFELVDHQDTLEVALNAPDTHLTACELRGNGIPAINNITQIIPGKVSKVNNNWRIEKKVIIYYGNK
jgi:hypothetical protein